MPKQSADPSKPPRRGNAPWQDILYGVGALALAGGLYWLMSGSSRVSGRGIVAGVILVIAGPVLIIRGLANAIKGGSLK